jgi:hypothetical protein
MNEDYQKGYDVGYRRASTTAYLECAIEFDMYLKDIPEEYRNRAKGAILRNLAIKTKPDLAAIEADRQDNS